MTATEKEFKFHSATVNEKGIKAGFDLDTEQWEAKQDISQYKEQAKLDREKQEHYGIRKDGYRKLATIPDIVAIDILQKYNLDLHDPAFMQDPNNLKKLKTILMTEYRDLVVNT
jgi:hypothetical protein